MASRTRSLSVAHSGRMSTLATADRNGSGGGSFSDLFLILQQHGIEHLAAHIADCGFGVNDLGNIFKNESDVTRLLRVTNKSDKAKLVGLAAHIRFVDERYLAMQQEREEMEEEAAANAAANASKGVTNGEDGKKGNSDAPASARRPHSPPPMSTASTTAQSAAIGQQTFLFKVPTNPTANEYCRQAATFLEYYRVDRAWPKKRSVLSKTLGLPTAEDPLVVKSRTADHIATHKLYTAGGSGGGVGSSRGNAPPPTQPAGAADVGAATTTTTSYETGGDFDGEGTIFKVFQRPARHFSVPTDGSQRARHAKSLREREEAIRRGQYGGSWKEVGQRNPDKGGALDPFPTAKGPSLRKLHAMHSDDEAHDCGHGGGSKSQEGNSNNNLYESHTVHQHGCQARQCPVCKHHAREKHGDGAWQYLAMVRLPPQFDASKVAVDLKAILKKRRKNKKKGSSKRRLVGLDDEDGDGPREDGDDDEEATNLPTVNSKGEELVPMWVPFPASDSLILETAFRKKAITILVRGKLANLAKMRWNKRPLRRSHAGDVPFPLEHGLKNNMMGGGNDTDDEVDAMEEALRKAAEAELLAQAIRDSFLKLLGAEEDKSRVTIEAEEDTQRRSLKADMERKKKQIYNALLENVVRDEEIARRAIRAAADKAFEDTILGPLADQWRQEEVRRLARQEVAAAKAILAQQRAMVLDHEASGRRAIEAEEADEWAQLERALRHLHAQIALFHKQLYADRNGGAGGCTGGFEDGTRCAKCLDPDCPFHRKPWANHWRRVGGALDVKPFSLAIDTLDGLVATALDRQYEVMNEAGRAGGWSGASFDTAAGGGVSAVSRARGISNMRYNSTQRKAKYTDSYAVDANGNVAVNNPSPTKKVTIPTRPQTVSGIRSRPQSPLGEPVHHSSSPQQQPRPPSAAAAPPQQQSQSRPQSAAARRSNPSPPPPPAAVPSSGYNYPEQPSIRTRRALEDQQKPAPIRHSRSALDPNDVYRSAEASDRSPRQQRAQSSLGGSTNSVGGRGRGYETPRFSDNFGSGNGFQHVQSEVYSEAPLPPAQPHRRRKMVRGELVDDGEEGGTVPESNVTGSFAAQPACHAQRFGFGHVVKQNDKIVGDEFKPKVVSHYDRMKAKLQKGADKNLSFLRAM